MSTSFTKLAKFSFPSFSEISNFLLFLFSFWHPCDANVGMFEVVPEAAYTILIFLDSFFFLFCVVGFCFFLFQIIDLILSFIPYTVVSM